jgi:1-acyl-sn-glycerol-3-phosphate acyltransferase
MLERQGERAVTRKDERRFATTPARRRRESAAREPLRYGFPVIHAIRYLLIVVYTVFWGAPAAVLALLGASEAVVWIGRRWISWILWTCRIRVEASGLENIDPSRPAIYMSNHQSVFDIAAIVSTIPVSYRFVAKRELTWIPVFGWALAASGHVIIDRGRRERAVRSLERAAARVRGGVNVIIFPEGTRSRTGELREFKSGGFHLAIQAGVPILPVSISGSRAITPKGSLRIESGSILVRYGEPIPTEKLSEDDRSELKDAVRRAIHDGMDPRLQRAPEPGRHPDR